jgi:hypothetical protein
MAHAQQVSQHPVRRSEPILQPAQTLSDGPHQRPFLSRFGGIRGQLVAHFDVARGHYEILTLGLPAPWRSEFARILRDRYGIEQRVVAGCMVTPSLLAYTEGYNQVSMTAANLKFGRDVFKESADDAMAKMRPPPPRFR